LVINVHGFWESTVYGISSEESSECLRRAKIIDCHDFEFGVESERRSKERPSRAPEAVDCYTNRHLGLLWSTSSCHLVSNSSWFRKEALM
jgi:hypothetical protein